MAVWHDRSVRWYYHVSCSESHHQAQLSGKRGGEGMRFSLQTREIIADSIETITCAQFHDANISIPGCDKNMPGVVVSTRCAKTTTQLSYGSDGNGKTQQTLCNDLRWYHQPRIFKNTKKDNQHHNVLR